MEIHVHSTRKYMYGVQQMCQCASEIGMIVWKISDTVVKSAGKEMSYTLVTQNIGKFIVMACLLR